MPVIESAKIASQVQKLAAGELVDLFELDAMDLGAVQKYYFTSNTYNGASIVFNGITYYPLNFEISGFEVSSSGQLPEPSIRLSNIGGAIASAAITLGDLVGAKLIRRRTFAKFLDGRVEADVTAQFPVESYVIDQKVSHNKEFLEFKLISFYDYTGIQIPKRQVLRSSCNFRYRIYDGSVFVYPSPLECPYTGSTYFDKDGNPTLDPAEDRCGKRLSDCRLRFPGDNTPVPYGGFPMVAKARTRR